MCPPYDVISDNEAITKKAVNAIRLELPERPSHMDQYAAAKQTMDDWLKKGILSLDNENTVYVYEQEFEIENISFFRRGFIALHKLAPERILTHEETRKKAKADREQLISTLKTYTSLIFGLYEDKDKKIEDILAGSPKEKIYDFIDEQSIRNRFYRMTDTDAINRLVSIMDTKNIYIADGHHRLGVSYKLNVPYVPFYLTNMYSPGIVILPYHRIVNFEKTRPLTELLDLLKGYADVVQIPYSGKDSVKAALSRITGGAKTSFVLYSKDDPQHLYIVTENKPFPAYENRKHPRMS